MVIAAPVRGICNTAEASFSFKSPLLTEYQSGTWTLAPSDPRNVLLKLEATDVSVVDEWLDSLPSSATAKAQPCMTQNIACDRCMLKCASLCCVTI